MAKLNDLDTLIPQYAANKSELDNYKKICDNENAKIKSIMTDFVVSNYETGGYKASRSVQQRESINEEILLSLFQTVPSFVKLQDKYEIVKNKPYIDFDALEKALYDGAVSDEQIADLDKAREVKEVVTLRVTKIKNKETE